ncbi:MAG: hypothetical protein V1929_00090 [bacterium]
MTGRSPRGATLPRPTRLTWRLDDTDRCFMRTEMDYLVLGSFLLSKKHQPEWKEKENWHQDYVLD